MINPINILSLDDDPRMALDFKRECEALDVNLITCTNDQEFFRYLNGDINVVILDLFLPGTNGVDVLNEISKYSSAAKLILISGGKSEILRSAVEVAKRLNLVVLGSLEKPFIPGSISNLLVSYGSNSIATNIQPINVINVTISDIEMALKNGEFLNYYQPKVDAINGSVIGIEALIRWRHPTFGLIGPDNFISLAESTGLIDDIGWWVAKQSIFDLKKLNDIFNHNLVLSINASAFSMNKLNYVDELMTIVMSNNIDPRSLILEITESGLSSDPAAFQSIVTKLRMVEIGVSIDDFGTGHSNLLQIQNIPATEIKIDKSFVQSAMSNSAAMATVEFSIRMGAKLKMKSVAEGVEDVAQVSYLKELGCDLLQGYFYSKPIPIEDLITWISENIKLSSLKSASLRT